MSLAFSSSSEVAVATSACIGSRCVVSKAQGTRGGPEHSLFGIKVVKVKVVRQGVDIGKSFAATSAGADEGVAFAHT